MEEVLVLLANMFKEIFKIVDKIYTSFNAWSLVIGAFTIYTIYRLLLVPVMGSAIHSGASDMVRSFKNREKAEGVSGLEKKGRSNG